MTRKLNRWERLVARTVWHAFRPLTWYSRQDFRTRVIVGGSLIGIVNFLMRHFDVGWVSTLSKYESQMALCVSLILAGVYFLLVKQHEMMERLEELEDGA